MERPNIPHILEQLKSHGCTIDLTDVTYFVGHETVTARQDGKGLPHWQEALFVAMERNAVHVTDYFRLPPAEAVASNPLSPVHLKSKVPLSLALVWNVMKGLEATAGESSIRKISFSL